MSPDGLLPEIVELPDHPWFVGVQFHPELKSKPFAPHPLFAVLHRGRGRAVAAGLRRPPMHRHVTIGPVTIGNDLPLVLIAGPCAIESRDARARDRGRAGRDRARRSASG